MGWAGGVALALILLGSIPVPVLAVTDGTRLVAEHLPEQGLYTYSYTNSIYDADVEERHVREADHLRVVEVSSPDIRAVEYFRWAGQPSHTDGRWQQQAPPNSTERLVIRITPRYLQRLRGAGWAIDLAKPFGDGVVSVTPSYLPILTAIPLGWRL